MVTIRRDDGKPDLTRPSLPASMIAIGQYADRRSRPVLEQQAVDESEGFLFVGLARPPVNAFNEGMDRELREVLKSP